MADGCLSDLSRRRPGFRPRFLHPFPFPFPFPFPVPFPVPVQLRGGSAPTLVKPHPPPP